MHDSNKTESTAKEYLPIPRWVFMLAYLAVPVKFLLSLQCLWPKQVLSYKIKKELKKVPSYIAAEYDMNLRMNTSRTNTIINWYRHVEEEGGKEHTV